MKTILLLSLILAVIATASTAAQASGTIGIDSTISQMKQDLQIQVERIRRARETASSEMTLARIRIAEQLRRSEEDLSRQIESLERFREQMADQKGETDQAVVRMQKDWKQFIQQAFSDLDSQLRETNSLITQMEALRDRFDVDPDELPQPTKEQIMTPSAPQPPANPQPVTPTPTVTQTPPANPEPATTTPTVTAATPTSTGST
jgi:predicted nuclease with TOPRIM domain